MHPVFGSSDSNPESHHLMGSHSFFSIRSVLVWVKCLSIKKILHWYPQWLLRDHGFVGNFLKSRSVSKQVGVDTFEATTWFPTSVGG